MTQEISENYFIYSKAVLQFFGRKIHITSASVIFALLVFSSAEAGREKIDIDFRKQNIEEVFDKIEIQTITDKYHLTKDLKVFKGYIRSRKCLEGEECLQLRYIPGNNMENQFSMLFLDKISHGRKTFSALTIIKGKLPVSSFKAGDNNDLIIEKENYIIQIETNSTGFVFVVEDKAGSKF